MHPYFINPLDRKTRLANVLRASYTLVGSVAHVSSAGKAMVSIASDVDVTIICPKVLISAFSEIVPAATFITPQSAVKRPPSSKFVLWMYSGSGGATMSSVLRKK